MPPAHEELPLSNPPVHQTEAPAPPPEQAARERSIRTRRIGFQYPGAELTRHYMKGDLLMSHIVTVLSASFPRGEDFFVHSLRIHRDQIADPELKGQVAGFIGQEAVHGREHRAFNERLADLGYPTTEIDRTIGAMFDLVEKVVPKKAQLAMTAAFEHYTAVIGEQLLTVERAQDTFEDDEIRRLFLWHAMEETEHQAVAFDAYQSISGDYLLRVGAMAAITVVWGAFVVTSTIRSMRRDTAAADGRERRRSLSRLRKSPSATRDVLHHLLAYNRPGFHPDQRDSDDLLAHWRTELFGPDGSLTAKLKSTA